MSHQYSQAVFLSQNYIPKDNATIFIQKTGSGVILVPHAYHYMSGQIYPPMAGLPFPKSHGCSTTPVEGILCLHFG